MLIRIVRMDFDPDKVSDFLQLFEEVQPKIAAFEGCKEVKLKKDATHSHVYYTHSKWDSEEALNQYRQSDFFQSTWARTKLLFQSKPLAYSLIDP